jgi:hypothetical protein
MANEPKPLEAGKFSKGGRNTQPMTPRPNFVPAPLGNLTPIGGANNQGPRESNPPKR